MTKTIRYFTNEDRTALIAMQEGELTFFEKIYEILVQGPDITDIETAIPPIEEQSTIGIPIDIPTIPPTAKLVKKKSEKVTIRTPQDKTIKNKVLELLETMSPKDVANKLNMSVANVYVIKSQAKKTKLSAEMQDTRPIDEFAPKEGDTTGNGTPDHILVQKITELWVDQNLSSGEVCRQLKISMGKLNKTIMQYKIARPNR